MTQVFSKEIGVSCFFLLLLLLICPKGDMSLEQST